MTDKIHHAAAAPLSVKGSSEGVVDVYCESGKVTGSFTISLTVPKNRKAVYYLYRLRVREASILFSKTYGFLGADAMGCPHPSVADTIILYTQPSVLDAGRLSAIRVEYIAVSEEDAAQLLQHAEAAKEVCQPFFSRQSPLHFQVSCELRCSQSSSSAAISPKAPARRCTYPRIGTIVMMTVLVCGSVAVAERRGWISWQGLIRLVPKLKAGSTSPP